MSRKKHTLNRMQKQKGLGLVSAIFVITVLAVIIAGMSRFFAFSQNVTVQEFLGARSMTAAQAGIELELTCLLHGLGGCTASAAVGSTTINSDDKDKWPSSSSFNLPGLQGCHAEVFYMTVESSEGTFWTIDSTGICGDEGLDGASRKVVIRAAQN